MTTRSSPTLPRRAASYAAQALALLLLGLVHLPQTAFSQEVVILKSADIAAYNEAIAAFKANLPSPDTTIKEYNLQGDIERGRKIGRKLRASHAKLILAVGLKAALVAKLEILDIPVIFCMVLNPDKYGLRATNMTGIGLQISIKRQLNSIRSILPKLKRVGVLYDPEKTADLVKKARHLAKSQGLEILALPVFSEKEVPKTLREALPDIEALWLVPDSTVLTQDSLDFLLSTTLEANIPVIGFSSGLVRSGAMVGLYAKYEDVGRQAARLAARILGGKRIPASTVLPLEHVRLAINTKVADFLDISIPPRLRREADELF